MSYKKILILSGVIAFLLSTIIFACTFSVFSYFSLFLSYIPFGSLLFITFCCLFTKSYTKDKESTIIFLSIPFVMGLGLSVSILIKNYYLAILSFITKTIISSVGMACLMVLMLICIYAFKYNESTEKKSNT